MHNFEFILECLQSIQGQMYFTDQYLEKLSDDLRRTIVDLRSLGRSPGAIPNQLQIPGSSLQTTVRKVIQMCHHFVKGVDQNCHSQNPGTTEAQACHELETVGTPASLSPMKRV